MINNPGNMNLPAWFENEFDAAFAEKREILESSQEQISWQQAVFSYPTLSAFLLQQYRIGHENLDTYRSSYARYSALCQELPRILNRPQMPLSNHALMTIAYSLHREAFELLPSAIKRRLFADPLFERNKIAASNSSFFVLQILREQVAAGGASLEPFKKTALGLFFQRQVFFDGAEREEPDIVVVELCEIAKNIATPVQLKAQLLRVFLQTAHKPEFIARCQYLSQKHCALENSIAMLHVMAEQQVGVQLASLIGNNHSLLLARLPAIENFYHEKLFSIAQKKSQILASFLELVTLSERFWRGGCLEVAQPFFSTRYSPNEPLFYTAMVSSLLGSIRSLGRLSERVGMGNPFALEIYDNHSWPGRLLSFTELLAPGLQALVTLDMQRHRITYFLTQLQGRQAYPRVKNEVRLKINEFLERLSPESTVNESLYALENIISSVGSEFKYQIFLATFEGAPLMSVADYDNRCPSPQAQIRTQVIELLSEIVSTKAWLAARNIEPIAIEPGTRAALTFSNQAQLPVSARAPSPPR